MFMRNLLVSLFILTITTACDDYLSQVPDARIEPNTLDKLARINTSAYPLSDYLFTEQFTDLVGPTGNYPNGIGTIPPNTGGNIIDQDHAAAYRWQDISGLFQSTPTYFWDQSYKAIAHANEVLALIETISGDPLRKKSIKAEALLCRAYNHFMLVNVFGLHYDKEDNQSLGVPYITTPETNFQPKYTRHTIQEVYTLVEKDLLEGLRLVNDDYYTGSKKYHFTKDAALAFASRFYLWKRDYPKTIQYSNQLLGADPSNQIMNYDNITASTFTEIAQNYVSVSEPSNILMTQVYSLYVRYDRGYRLNNEDITNPTKGLFANPMNASDRRTQIGIFKGGTTTAILPRINTLFERASLSAQTGIYYHIAQLFKMEEVLLNRAEAHLLSPNPNLEAALQDLNTLTTNRLNGSTYTLNDSNRRFFGVADNQSLILSAILSERRKEFWMHGLRWFDIKRHQLEVRHQLPEDEGGHLLVLPKGDPRRAIQIPQAAIDNGIKPNIR